MGLFSVKPTLLSYSLPTLAAYVNMFLFLNKDYSFVFGRWMTKVAIELMKLITIFGEQI